MEVLRAVVSDSAKHNTLDAWYQTTLKRIERFEGVELVLDTEFGPCALILDKLQNETFARNLGADQLRPSTNALVRHHTPKLCVCGENQQFGTVGNLEKVGLRAEYDTSRQKLGKRKGENAEKLSYNTSSAPYCVRLWCGAMRVMCACDGQPIAEDWIFPWYIWQSSHTHYGACANTADQKQFLKYMAMIWCALLSKAVRIYSWGSIDITLPLDWFVQNNYIALDRRNLMLKQFGWNIKWWTDQSQRTYYEPHFDSKKQTATSIYHNLQSSLRCPQGSSLQACVNYWMTRPGANASAQTDMDKLLRFEDLDLMYAIGNHTPISELLPQTSNDARMIFSTFDQKCSDLAQFSLPRYNHQDVVLVCKLMRVCGLLRDSDSKLRASLGGIYNAGMLAFDDPAKPATTVLVFFQEPDADGQEEDEDEEEDEEEEYQTSREDEDGSAGVGQEESQQQDQEAQEQAEDQTDQTDQTDRKRLKIRHPGGVAGFAWRRWSSMRCTTDRLQNIFLVDP